MASETQLQIALTESTQDHVVFIQERCSGLARNSHGGVGPGNTARASEDDVGGAKDSHADEDQAAGPHALLDGGGARVGEEHGHEHRVHGAQAGKNKQPDERDLPAGGILSGLSRLVVDSRVAGLPAVV
jgi:hypothetical protein